MGIRNGCLLSLLLFNFLKILASQVSWQKIKNVRKGGASISFFRQQQRKSYFIQAEPERINWENLLETTGEVGEVSTPFPRKGYINSDRKYNESEEESPLPIICF